METFRNDFPDSLDNFIYFDNASTAQNPIRSINAVSNFYKEHNASIGKGIFKESIEASELYENARDNVADFFGANSNQIFFSAGATDGINQIAYGLEKCLKKGDKIVVTELEHHSNLLPWIRISKKLNVDLDYITVNSDGELNYDEIQKKIDNRTKIVAFTAASNVIGQIVDIGKFVSAAKNVGAITVLDAVQLAPHRKINFTELGIDFGIVASHKMFGPTGIGIVFGKNLDNIEPFKLGGGIVIDSSMKEYELATPPILFEAGTQNTGGAVGLSESINFLKENNIFSLDNEQKLHENLYNGLKNLDFVKIVGKNENKVPIISFTIDNVHPHDVSQYLASKNIAIRAGHHCAKPLHKKLGLNATNRASMVFYNSLSEVDIFIQTIKQIKEYF